MNPRLRLAAAFAACVLLPQPLVAQTINPAVYGNITLHLKAGDLALSDTQPVATWGPMTAAGTAQPLFISSDASFNNKPAVKFDGINDVMTRTAANTNARTIFAVVTMETGAPSLATLLSNGADGLDVRRNGTTNFYRGPGQAMNGSDFPGNGTPTGTLSVNQVASGSFSPGIPHLMMTVAGGQKNYSTMWLGNASSALSRYWRGSVAEVLIYDGELTAEGIDRVGYYFQTKYALPTAFPAPPPLVHTFTATGATGVTSTGGLFSIAGSPVALTWNVEGADSVQIDNSTLAAPGTAQGTVNVSPSVTTTYTLAATNIHGTTTRAVTIHLGVTPQPPRLNEFLAENDSGLTDSDGEHADWIELHNPNPYAIDLHGYRLKDGEAQWDFPVGSGIGQNGFRVIFASGKNRINPSAELHTNFNLGNAGEYLALVRVADNAALTEFAPAYPGQYADISFGYWGNPLQPGYFGTATSAPTPGAPNSATGVLGFLDKTDDTHFSVHRGFFTTAVTTVVSARTPGATLVYTTDGSLPSETNGTQVPPADAATPPSVTVTIHPGTVPAGVTGVNLASIGGVTTLRATAFKAGYSPTNVDTQTYLFPAQVLGQTVANATARGWPTGSVNGQIFNYGMDPNVVSSFTPAEMTSSLESLPTLSIVTDMRNLVNAATGIYVNADQHGAAWERPVSAEMIHPPGYIDPDGNAEGFQIEAGLRIRGGYSRNDTFYKHGLRLFFSNDYDGKLRYRMFGNEGTDEFGKLDLGTSSNYAWYRESSYGNGRFNTMCRDMFCRDTQGALGQPYTKSRFYHLYLNGHYWGIYYTEERAEAEFAASYMGGDASEYDAVKCGNHIGNFATEATDGTMDTWRILWNKTRSIGTAGATNAKYFEIQGRNPDGTRNPALPVLLDVDNLIDEMLVIFYAGDGDAVLSNFLGNDRPNNWFSVYRRGGDQGFRFFIRDAEHTLGTPSSVVDHTGPFGGSYVNDFTYSNPQRIHQDLMSSAEYKLKFGDHVQRHFFNNGALTPAKCIARFQRRADQVRAAMKVESARWGDAQSISGLPAGHPPRYLVTDWESAVTSVTNTTMPGRTQIVLNQLKTDGLYPATAAPVFASDATGTTQHGGSVDPGFALRMTAAAGEIRYTLDGSDPRGVDSLPTAGALTYSTPVPVSSPVLVSARALNGVLWSALTTALFTVNTVPASASNLVVSQLDYNPTGGNGFEFLEFMNISAQSVDLTGVHIRLSVDYDFPANTLVPPGGRVQVVGDRATFATRYGAAPGLRVLGPMVGNLSNGGERVLVVSDTQGTLRDFTYDDDQPWPTEADGGGFRLMLIRPSTNPDHALASSWRGSVAVDAPPGASDTTGFVGNPAIDADADGVTAWMEYALGRSDTQVDPWSDLISGVFVSLPTETANEQFFTVSFRRALAADDAECLIEVSDELGAWTGATPPPVLLTRTGRTSGSVTETWRLATPLTATPHRFVRLRLRQR